MIFKRLRIRNFGVFCGTHEFDLEPRVKYRRLRPIILFGGKNGSGKTTILEAVLLCLYGRIFLGNQVGKTAYHTYLADRIHRPGGGRGVVLNASCIQLEFSYSHFGVRCIYRVERSWSRAEGNLDEQFKVERDGDKLSSFEADHAQDFLKNLIPLGVSDLFFFNGEKIQSLADEKGDRTVLAKSLKAMLSLDIVEKLQSDLRIYLFRQKKQRQGKEVKARIRIYVEEMKSLEERRMSRVQDRAQNQSRIEYLLAKIEQAENTLLVQGGIFAARRNEYRLTEATLHAEIERTENRIREECVELFPFAFLPELCRQLEEQLQIEIDSQRWTVAQELVEQSIETIEQRLEESILRPIRENSKYENATSIPIKKMLLNAIRPERAEKAVMLHNLSNPDSQRIQHWLTDGILASRKAVMENIQRLEENRHKLNEVELLLSQVPDDDILTPHLRKLNELNQEMGSLQATADAQDEEIRQLNSQLDQITREYKKCIDELSVQEDILDRLQRINDVQGVLGEFSNELTRVKVTQLEAAVSRCFGTLCRKGDIIRRIEIDPITFVVTFFNREGRKIPKTELSAGEKQIYAVSMLWALAQTSARPLPIIMDTPLGRLDSDHRKRLVESYFPSASHQVVILSTDTEIDRENLKALGSNISHAYDLRYDSESESAFATEGYFWNRNGEPWHDDEQDKTLFRSIGTT